MSAVEKIIFYGYAFINLDGRCEAYVPQKDEQYNWETEQAESPVDDPNFVADCEAESKKRVSNRQVMLVFIENMPTIGDRVDSGKYTATTGTYLSNIHQLRPIGKFGLDEYYQLSGRCTLVALDKDEQTLIPAQLIKKARAAYLEYRKINPPGSLRTVEDLRRLGFHEMADRRERIQRGTSFFNQCILV